MTQTVGQVGQAAKDLDEGAQLHMLVTPGKRCCKTGIEEAELEAGSLPSPCTLTHCTIAARMTHQPLIIVVCKQV